MKLNIPVLLLLIISTVPAFGQVKNDKLSILKREEMVLSLQKEVDLSSPLLKAALLKVHRERFIPEQYKSMAYSLISIPLDQDRILPSPVTLAEMLSSLKLKKGEKVLVLGKGTSYTAALLLAMEMDTWVLDKDYSGELSDKRRVKWSEGWEDWISEAPFDVIIIHSAYKNIPGTILEQLSNDGGRIVFPLRTESGYQPLIYITKENSTYDITSEKSGFFSNGK